MRGQFGAEKGGLFGRKFQPNRGYARKTKRKSAIFEAQSSAFRPIIYRG